MKKWVSLLVFWSVYSTILATDSIRIKTPTHQRIATEEVSTHKSKGEILQESHQVTLLKDGFTNYRLIISGKDSALVIKLEPRSWLEKFYDENDNSYYLQIRKKLSKDSSCVLELVYKHSDHWRNGYDIYKEILIVNVDHSSILLHKIIFNESQGEGPKGMETDYFKEEVSFRNDTLFVSNTSDSETPTSSTQKYTRHGEWWIREE